MSRNSRMTIEMDDTAQKSIEDLKTFFKVETRAGVIRRAIALAGVLATSAKDKTIVVRDQRTVEPRDVTILVG